MYRIHNPLLWLLLAGLTGLSCGGSRPVTQKEAASAPASLKTAFSQHFYIGTALGAQMFQGSDPRATRLIQREFNAATPENVMKSQVIHPEPGRYDFTQADQFMAFAEAQQLTVFGHTLIWHSQLSSFATKIQTADSMTRFMEDHIATVAGRYAGRIKGWDVVNEALEEDGSMRPSVFYKTLGEDYVAMAFKMAQKADPKAELYYNDYNIEQPKKREGAIRLIKKIQASGARIDGVGIQGHWSLQGAPIEEIEAAIVAFSQLGVKVMFTELDITVLPNPWDLKGADVNQNFEGSPFMNPYPQALPDSVQQQLADRYEALFRLFVKHADKIDRVTFWGVDDGHSWLNNWPIRGRTNYPLLFDRAYEPKAAYHRVMGVK
ncbi:MAG: endo-1,4-beta-xylanase [Bacteroidia bacterium]|nr:endo-1,4-beta-xylanase [Bacteroidia bacterium]